MSKVKDLVVKVREYEKDGQKKAEWLNIGVIMNGENGDYILLNRTFNPAGLPNPDDRTTVLVSMFDTKPREQQPPAFNDDIPNF